MKKYNTGFVIGRFQPLHKGHRYLFLESLKHCETLVIGIGSSNVRNKDNPFSYDERLKFINLLISNENMKDHISHIVPLPDIPDDDEWFGIAKKAGGEFDVVIGNNEWTNGIFQSHGFDILTFKYYNRDELEGQKIRKLMKERKRWENRVPQYIAEMIKQSEVSIV